MNIKALSVLTIFIVLLAVNAFAEPAKKALVIGNGQYKVSPLKNPVNDATDIANELRRLGFIVTLLTNADQVAMEKGIKGFTRSLNKGDVTLFYYAGHGMQVSGVNYIIPIGSSIEDSIDVKYKAVNMGQLMDRLGQTGSSVNIAILDACRNNPFASAFRSGSRGLARMDAPTGTIIAYATAPGKVAADGNGRNGVYTGALLKHMRTPGLDLDGVFKRVRRDVLQETGNKQVPWESSSLIGDFHFVKAVAKPDHSAAELAKLRAELLKLKAESAKPKPALPPAPKADDAEMKKLRTELMKLKAAAAKSKATKTPDPKADTTEAKKLRAELTNLKKKKALPTNVNFRDFKPEEAPAAALAEINNKHPGKIPFVMLMVKQDLGVHDYGDKYISVPMAKLFAKDWPLYPAFTYYPTSKMDSAGFKMSDDAYQKLWQNGKKNTPNLEVVNRLAKESGIRYFIAVRSVWKGRKDETRYYAYLIDTENNTIKSYKRFVNYSSGGPGISHLSTSVYKVMSILLKDFKKSE